MFQSLFASTKILQNLMTEISKAADESLGR
jgi:hypothetical protein